MSPEDKKRAVLEATLRVLARQGPRGVTHRAVSREAGLGLRAATYYFDSREHLLTDALRRGDRRSSEKIVRGDRTPFGRVAGRLLESGATEAVALEVPFEPLRRDGLACATHRYEPAFAVLDVEAGLDGMRAWREQEGERVVVEQHEALEALEVPAKEHVQVGHLLVEPPAKRAVGDH